MKTNLPQQVKIVEVGPRDGLQNEKAIIPLDLKVSFINQLTEAGFHNIEAASFVSPKWVPQMETSREVMKNITRRKGIIYSALTPNMKGFEAALEAQADEVVIFSSASEAFAQKNINCSIAESIARFTEVAKAAKAHQIRLRGSISCTMGCPYQGVITTREVIEVVQRMQDLGCDEIDIADTIGVGTAHQVQSVMQAVSAVYPLAQIAGHFHDTYGQALANIYASLEVGISIFHASVAGLGGCPYAKGATGNVATEDVLFMLNGLGIETGVDIHKVALAGQFISQHLGRKSSSRAGNALAASIQKPY